MKTLNFSVVEKLPSLLNKSCSQTIRPAWNILKGTPATFSGKFSKKMVRLMEKPPRFSPKDQVSLYWNQRSKYEGFCRDCGLGRWNPPMNKCRECDLPTPWFGKYLGTVEIVEVFKIEIERIFAAA